MTLVLLNFIFVPFEASWFYNLSRLCIRINYHNKIFNSKLSENRENIRRTLQWK